MTDSVGIQEDAQSLEKLVIVLRDAIERPQGIEVGTLKLAGVDKDGIYDINRELFVDHRIYNSMAKSCNPYGY